MKKTFETKLGRFMAYAAISFICIGLVFVIPTFYIFFKMWFEWIVNNIY